MDGKKAGTLAALSLVVLSQGATASTFTAVIVAGDSVGGDLFGGAGQVVLADNGDVGMIGQLANDGDAVFFSQASGGGYVHSVVASNAQLIPGSLNAFSGFENLSLTTSGRQSKLVFSSPVGSATEAGLFQSTDGSAATAVFYSSGGRTLITGGSVGNPLGYGVSSDGHVAFGTKNGAAQELHVDTVDTVANAIDTGTLENFNQTQSSDDQRYLVKRAVTGANSVVGVATSGGTWGVYNFGGTGAPVARYQTINTGLDSYAPRRLLGATASASVVVAESASDSTTGGLFYEQAGSLTPIITGINPGGALAGEADDPIGQMTAGGKVAAYLPEVGVVYYDTTAGVKVLASGVHGATTIDSFGLPFFPVLQPMVNDQGWVVFEAVLPGGVFGTAALLAWQPETDILQILAQVGDTVNLNGNDAVIEGFFRAVPSFDSDVLRDGLNENNEVAFSVTTTGGSAVLVTTIVVPEPAVLVMAMLGAPLLLRRRRR